LSAASPLVTKTDGTPVKSAAEAPQGADVNVRFADGGRMARLDPDANTESGAVPDTDDNPGAGSPKPARRRKAASKPPSDNQDSLF
jgi:hypothetical protein